MNQVTALFKRWWPLLLIFLAALFLRTWHLDQLPATFFDDEVLSGYLGRFLWENGIDLYGNRWPLLYFNKFGDYYIILPMYMDGLSTYIFGLTWFAVRLPTAFLGALSIFPLAGIAHIVFRTRKITFLAALFFALLPWHIVLSRATTESIIELCCLLCVTFCLMWGWSKQRLRWLILAFCLSVVSYLVYHTSRLLLPLLWIGGIGLYWSRIRGQKAILTFMILGFVMLTSLTLYISSTPWGKGRFSQTSVFSEQSGVQGRIQEMIFNLGSDSAVLARLLYNKPLGFGRELLRQYVSYFSPLYLFTADGWSKTRYAVPEAGPILVTYGLILLSLLVPTRRRLVFDTRGVLFLVWILLISVIPASLTVIESPSIRRSVVMVFPISIFTAYALYRSWFIRFWHIPIGLVLLSLLLVEWVMFGFLYVNQSDRVTSIYRSDGYPQLAAYLLNHSGEYEKIVVANKGSLPLHYLFAKQDFSPQWSHQFGLDLHLEALDTVTLIPENCPSQQYAHLLTPGETWPEKTVFIDDFVCQYDKELFTKIGSVNGVNPLLGFNLLQLTELAATSSSATKPLVPLDRDVQ